MRRMHLPARPDGADTQGQPRDSRATPRHQLAEGAGVHGHGALLCIAWASPLSSQVNTVALGPLDCGCSTTLPGPGRPAQSSQLSALFA